MNNPTSYNFYVKNSMFEKEREEHGEEFFKIVIDRIAYKLEGTLGGYSRNKLTAGIVEVYSCELRINAIKFEIDLGL